MTTNTNGVAAKLRQIDQELAGAPDSELIERAPQIHALRLADISGVNTFLLGPPGTAKSQLIRAQCSRYVGANYWEILLDRQLDKESMFGPVDIKEFEATGAWHRRVDGYAPTAHKAFLDEVGKAGPAVLNPMLTWMNEHLFHNNSKPMVCPIISVAGASNEELIAIDPELAALWDRWLIRIQVNPIEEPGNFDRLLQLAFTPPAQKAKTTVTLDEIKQANRDSRQILVPPGIRDNIRELRSQLRADQITPSDRRWLQSVFVLQASAYYNERSAVDEDDFGIFEHILWDVVEQIPTVRKHVLQFAGATSAKLVDLQTKLEDIEKGIDSRRGQSVESRAQYGGEANFKLGEIGKDLKRTIDELDQQGRSTTQFHELRQRLAATKQRVYVECLNMPADKVGV